MDGGMDDGERKGDDATGGGRSVITVVVLISTHIVIVL